MAVCIKVTRSDTGILDIPGAATEEDFSEVAMAYSEQDADYEKLGELKGWGPWTHWVAFHVPIGGGWATDYYFVRAD